MTDYAELQQAVIEDTHRPDLAALVPRFISEGEGMIRREMTAVLISTTLTEADRNPDNIAQYILPLGSLIIRRVAVQGATRADVPRIALGSIGVYASTHRIAVYVESGSGTIEFRGNPPQDTIFDLDYFGMPAPLVEPDDTIKVFLDNVPELSPILSHHKIHSLFLKSLTNSPCFPSGLMGIRSPTCMFWCLGRILSALRLARLSNKS